MKASYCGWKQFVNPKTLIKDEALLTWHSFSIKQIKSPGLIVIKRNKYRFKEDNIRFDSYMSLNWLCICSLAYV